LGLARGTMKRGIAASTNNYLTNIQRAQKAYRNGFPIASGLHLLKISKRGTAKEEKSGRVED